MYNFHIHVSRLLNTVEDYNGANTPVCDARDFNDTHCRHIDSCGYAAILNFKMAAINNIFICTSRLASTLED